VAGGGALHRQASRQLPNPVQGGLVPLRVADVEGLGDGGPQAADAQGFERPAEHLVRQIGVGSAAAGDEQDGAALSGQAAAPVIRPPAVDKKLGLGRGREPIDGRRQDDGGRRFQPSAQGRPAVPQGTDQAAGLAGPAVPAGLDPEIVKERQAGLGAGGLEKAGQAPGQEGGIAVPPGAADQDLDPRPTG